MTIDRENYRLTKHGRQRFIERVGLLPDNDIIKEAAKGIESFRFIWRPDGTGLRLVTVLKGSG